MPAVASRIILVANPKGGSGKSTTSSTLASHYAWSGERVMLGDLDRQQTLLHWLRQRPAQYPPIETWQFDNGKARPPAGVTRVILDSPANLHGKKLAELIKQVDRVVVPVQASAFDIWASEAFLQVLAEEKAIRKHRAFVGVIGMRADSRTKAAQMLQEFLQRLDVPVLTTIRDTQNYVQAASQGLSIFDLPPARSERDRAEWAPVLDWLDDRQAVSHPTFR